MTPKTRYSRTVGVVALLAGGDTTAYQLHKAAGLHPESARIVLRNLHKRNVVHICGWLKDSMNRDAVPVYRLGAGDDVPKEKSTSAERMRRYRAKLKALKNAAG